MTIGQLAVAPACQVCGERQMREVEGFAALPRITSDCRAYPAGGALHVCIACGGVQKVPDSKWLQEIGGIYTGYEAYYQSGGDEQIVFDTTTGTPRRRSEVILDRLIGSAGLAPRGRALDVGCGNGATLAAMSTTLLGWAFSGYELSEGALPRLSQIPRFEKLHTGSLDSVGESYNLITLVHALEHFPDPMAALSQLRRLVGEGQLFIEVCNVDENPFDILVADHLMHFNPYSLERLLERAGFGQIAVATDWVPKEISLLARAVRGDRRLAFTGKTRQVPPGELVLTRMISYVAWLQAMVARAGQLAHEDSPLGIFGTSIAATWLASQLEEKVSFFVDEDESRVGKRHLGRCIVRPQEVPAGAKVYIALAPAIAGVIAARHARLPCRLIMPPPLQLDSA